MGSGSVAVAPLHNSEERGELRAGKCYLEPELGERRAVSSTMICFAGASSVLPRGTVDDQQQQQQKHQPPPLLLLPVSPPLPPLLAAAGAPSPERAASLPLSYPMMHRPPPLPVRSTSVGSIGAMRKTDRSRWRPFASESRRGRFSAP